MVDPLQELRVCLLPLKERGRMGEHPDQKDRPVWEGREGVRASPGNGASPGLCLLVVQGLTQSEECPSTEGENSAFLGASSLHKRSSVWWREEVILLLLLLMLNPNTNKIWLRRVLQSGVCSSGSRTTIMKVYTANTHMLLLPHTFHNLFQLMPSKKKNRENNNRFFCCYLLQT